MELKDDPLARVLHAVGAYEPYAEKLQLFGRFVGAWDLVWHGSNRAGQPLSVPGELHFGWIMGGRAVQDVWRVPLNPTDAGGLRGFYGTTVRFYDPEIDAWRSTWIDPLNARVMRFVGRPDGDGIVLTSIETDVHERWSFREITPDSFRWIGEASGDGGRTYEQYEEMRATRRR